MKAVLSQDFFARPTLTVARELLGKKLVRKQKEDLQTGIITEVEAYDGIRDKACHGSRGRTERTQVMFGPAGYWYVYFIYGMYWMLNIVTRKEGIPSAVLIRGVGDWNGPGKLTRSMHIDKSFDGKLATQATGLWIEDPGLVLPRNSIERTPRIGVEYAGEWAQKPWRFVLKKEHLSSLTEELPKAVR